MKSGKTLALAIILVLVVVVLWRDGFGKSPVTPPPRPVVAKSPAPSAPTPKIDFTNAKPCPDIGQAPRDYEPILVRVEIPGTTDGHRYAYGLRMARGQEPILLERGYDPIPEGKADQPGIDCNTFNATSVGSLILATWNNLDSRGGNHTDRGYSLLLHAGSGWKEVYHGTYCYVSFESNPAGSYHHRVEDEVTWNAMNKLVSIKRVQSEQDTTAVRKPFSVRGERKYTGGPLPTDVYKNTVELKTQWHFRVNTKGLQYVDGHRALNPGRETFELAEIPRYLGETEAADSIIARVRQLNPAFKKGDTFKGEVLLETHIPAPESNYNHHCEMPSKAP